MIRVFPKMIFSIFKRLTNKRGYSPHDYQGLEGTSLGRQHVNYVLRNYSLDCVGKMKNIYFSHSKSISYCLLVCNFFIYT